MEERQGARRRPASRSPSGLGSPASRLGSRPGWCRRPRPSRASPRRRRASPRARRPESCRAPETADDVRLRAGLWPPRRLLRPAGLDRPAHLAGPPRPPRPRGGGCRRARRPAASASGGTGVARTPGGLGRHRRRSRRPRQRGPSGHRLRGVSSDDPFAYDFLDLDDESSWIAREVRPGRQTARRDGGVRTGVPAPAPRPAEPSPQARRSSPDAVEPGGTRPVITPESPRAQPRPSRLRPGPAHGTEADEPRARLR